MDSVRAPPGSRTSRGAVKSSSRKLPSPIGKSPRNGHGPVTNGDLNTGSKEFKTNGFNSGVGDETPTRDVPIPDDSEDSRQISPRKAGVAYISENFIRRVTREDNLTQITTLNIMLGRDLNKKVKYLENLDGLKKLRALSASNHMIEKIEKLDKLVQLQELKLSNNCISQIEGLDTLVHLQVLDLSGNQIEHLPATLFKKLKEIQTFHIAHNKLSSLVEVARLRPLQDLTTFSVDGNPLAGLPHSRHFIIFQLRSVQILDRMDVTEIERAASDERFAQEEVRRLETELGRQERLYQTLSNEHQGTSAELKNLRKAQSEQNIKSTRQVEKIKELQHELAAKEDLLKSKNTELSRACQKQFSLEQELAFYKLDAKFDHLGKIPLPPDIQLGDEDDDESPYIGKAGFKPNKFTRDSYRASPGQSASLTPGSSRRSERFDGQNRDIEHELHQALQLDLNEKEQAIKNAEESLAQLEDQLSRRRKQLQDVSDQLMRIQQALKDQNKHLGEEERKLLDAIEDKKNYIRQLQEVAKELEERMDRVLDDIKLREGDLENLRHDMKNTSPDDAAYARLQNELAAKERQLRNAKVEHQKLRDDYNRAKERLKDEMTALKRLEEKLASRGARGGDDDLKSELKGIVDDLNAHLDSVKEQVAQQQQTISQLQQENDAFKQKVRELRAQNVGGLQQQLRAVQDAFENERKKAEGLRGQLSDAEDKSLQRGALESALAETKRRLRDAESEVARLQSAVDRLKQQHQTDRQAADERLNKEQERVAKALQAARGAGDKEREVKELAVQLAALQATNASMTDRLQEAEDELDSRAENSLDKADVLQRLEDLAEDIDRGRDQVRRQSGADEDLGRNLEELQQKYINLMNALKKKQDRGDWEKKTADAELQALVAKLQDVEDALAQTRDQVALLAKEKASKDGQLKKMADDLRKTKEKLAKQPGIEEELNRLKAAHEMELKDLQGQIAQLKDQLKRAERAMEEELASARAPLQAKIRDLKDDIHQLQRKLSKAKVENDKLKRAQADGDGENQQLRSKLKQLVDKLRDAEAMAEDAQDRLAREKWPLEAKIQGLEEEVERLRERLAKLQDNAEHELESERAASAAKVRGLEDELDRMKRQTKALKDRAENEAAKSRDLARKLKALEDEIEALRDELGKALARNETQARDKEAALQTLLEEREDRLQDANSQEQAHQTKTRALQDQTDDLRRLLQDAESQALKNTYEKDLEAVRKGRRHAATQEAAAKQLADTQNQIASLQYLLDTKDRQLQDQMRRETTGASSLASQRDDIRNLASALAAQNAELDKLKADLARVAGQAFHPGYAAGQDPNLTALANEVSALRAALRQREHQVQSLIQPLSYDTTYPHGIPHRTTTSLAASPSTGATTSFATTPVAIGPGSGLVAEPSPLTGSNLVTGTGEVHHHHHFSKKKSRRTKTPVSFDTSPLSPLIIGATSVTTPVSDTVHHHHYDGLPDNKEKNDKHHDGSPDNKEKNDKQLYCNVPLHEDLEYEVGHLEEMLTSTLQEARKNERESLRSDLRELEDEVNDALRQRSSSKRIHPHSLDGTLARFQDHLLTMLDHKTHLVSS